ncbi:MAG: ABC transporter ATP-binding protein [Thermoplasmata archaeon]|nr:ABC transporter ATP-binding protein [Candidatus Sysuiplasma acidicola]MBX8646786.1 ABC transporter ATP-binding protein [Candidatus Sysuiplasma acidicola]
MEDEIIALRKVTKDFRGGSGLTRSKQSLTRAMDKVTIGVKRGEFLGLVGESGSGKTTVGLAMLKLLDVDSGSIMYEGRDINRMSRRETRDFRMKTQMIFQDPYESLNPSLSIFKTVSTSLDVFRKEIDEDEKLRIVSTMLSILGLDPAEDFLFKLPRQLSGGQRQRIAIARAMILDPEFIVADEAVSMLDVSIRADILNRLIDLKNRRDFSMLFITHDIAVARYVSDRIAVMHLGQLVESGEGDSIINSPLHPYTQILINAVPSSEDGNAAKLIPFTQGDWEKVNRGYPGCSFVDRCPFVMDKCRRVRPELVEKSPGHFVACFLYE